MMDESNDNGPSENSSVPPHKLGIGNEYAKETLEDHVDRIWDHAGGGHVQSIEAKNSILDGIAHVMIELHERQHRIPNALANDLSANDLIVIQVDREGGYLTLRAAPRRYYEVWSAGIHGYDDS